MKWNRLSCVAVAIVLAGTGVVDAREPIFEGLGSYQCKITTDSRRAQRYFNQGLAFYHGFNHGEAIRSFQQATRLDPKCAMAHWGIALSCGPHINLAVVPPPAAELAWKELALAQQNPEHISPVERDLIEALSHRYANPQPEDRAPLDQAYADAMRTVWQKYPDDPDVGVLFAEAMMDLRPWNQWTPEGQPNQGQRITAQWCAGKDIELDELVSAGGHFRHYYTGEEVDRGNNTTTSTCARRTVEPASSCPS
jgi:hypothetical protein